MTIPLAKLLPEILDSSAAQQLLESLGCGSEGAVILDASAVRHLGGLCLQLLLIAARTVETRSGVFMILQPSGAFLSCLADLGAMPTLSKHLVSETPI